MDLTIIRNINQIIERDAKDSTYKFALLRGVIDSIQEFSHFNQPNGDRVEMKTGILVYNWLQYYYPIIDSDIFIRQKNGETEDANNLAFRPLFREVTQYYRLRGGLSVFINDLKKGRIDPEIESTVVQLLRKIAMTITRQPMCYIGKSVTNEEYGIFHRETGANGTLKASLNSLVDYCGTYSIPLNYFQIFEYLGGFITGRNSILMEWANFTVERSAKSKYEVEKDFVLKQLLEEPLDKREVKQVRTYFENKIKSSGKVYCIWSGKRLLEDKLMAIDHILPFAAWKNNDLWNLIPTHSKVNDNKNDSIPSVDFIERRADALINCWMEIHAMVPEAFQKDVQLGLIGSGERDLEKMLKASIPALQEKCDFLIEKRGMPAWEYVK